LDITVNGAATTSDGVITDLSLKGMRIETTHPVGAGDLSALNLPAFPNKPINVESRATNSLGDRKNHKVAGFRIKNITQRDARLVTVHSGHRL
jgi:hypothetical protein